jgi:hypothetical protein
VDKEDVFWTAQLLSDKVIVFKPEIQSVLFINSMRALWCWQRTTAFSPCISLIENVNLAEQLVV